MRKIRIIFSITLAYSLLITGCIKKTIFESSSKQADSEVTNQQTNSFISNPSEDNNFIINLYINNLLIPVTWEKNQSVKELSSLFKNGIITINTKRYGGFEQVGR